MCCWQRLSWPLQKGPLLQWRTAQQILSSDAEHLLIRCAGDNNGPDRVPAAAIPVPRDAQLPQPFLQPASAVVGSLDVGSLKVLILQAQI